MISSLIHLPHRAVLSLTGPDTITLLERLVTNATDDWADGTTRYGALLTPQGKVLSDYLALRIADGVLLDVAAEHVDDLAKRLKLFRLRSQVEIERLDDLIVLAGIEAAPRGVAHIPGTRHVYLDPRYPGGRLRGLAAQDSDAAPDEAHSIQDYHADRIAHAIPEQGFDFAQAEVFPADINMDVLGGVALNKGCFVGQEVVSRMHRRGQIRKRTLMFEVSDRAAIEDGSDLHAPAPIGTVTSHAALQGLARVRVDRFLKSEEAGATVTLDETPVTLTKPDWLLAEQEAMKQV